MNVGARPGCPSYSEISRPKPFVNGSARRLTAMNVDRLGNAGEVTMAEIMSVLRSSKASEVAGIAGKLIGVGLFAALIYSYASVLIESLVRSV